MFDPQTTRKMLKTRWSELDRSKTDQGRGRPTPQMQKPCGAERVALPEPGTTIKHAMAFRDAVACRESRRSFSGEALLKHHFGAAVDFIWTTVPYRCEWSYSWESLRLILLDAGHVCAHLYLACEDVGCGTCAVGAYDQQKLDALIGVDGYGEFAVYAAPVGKQR